MDNDRNNNRTRRPDGMNSAPPEHSSFEGENSDRNGQGHMPPREAHNLQPPNGNLPGDNSGGNYGNRHGAHSEAPYIPDRDPKYRRAPNPGNNTQFSQPRNPNYRPPQDMGTGSGYGQPPDNRAVPPQGTGRGSQYGRPQNPNYIPLQGSVSLPPQNDGEHPGFQQNRNSGHYSHYEPPERRYEDNFHPEEESPMYDEVVDDEDARKKRIFIIATSVVVALAVLIGAFFIIRAFVKDDSGTELEKITRTAEESDATDDHNIVGGLTDVTEGTGEAGARITRVITVEPKPNQTSPPVIPMIPATTETFQQWVVVEETTTTTPASSEAGGELTQPTSAKSTEASTKSTTTTTTTTTEKTTEATTEPDTKPTVPDKPALVDADKGPITVGNTVILPIPGENNYHTAEEISDIHRSSDGKNWIYKKDGKTYIVVGNQKPRELPENQTIPDTNAVTDVGYFFMDGDTLKRADLSGKNIADAAPTDADEWVSGNSSLRVLYKKDNTIAIADGSKEPVVLTNDSGNKAKLIALLDGGRIGIWADAGKIYAAADNNTRTSIEWDIDKNPVSVFKSERYTLLYQQKSKTAIRLTHDGTSDKKPSAIRLGKISLPDAVNDDIKIIDASDTDTFLILNKGALYRVKGNNEVTKDGTSVTQAGFMGKKYFMIVDKKLKVIDNIDESATYEEKATNVKLASFSPDASYLYYVQEGNLMTYPEKKSGEVVAGNVARYLPVKDKEGVLILKQDNQLVYVENGKEVKNFGSVKPETIDANVDYLYGGNAFVGTTVMIIPEDDPGKIAFEKITP